MALVIKEIEGERDRGAALIAATLIDERLAQTIKLRLRSELTPDDKKVHAVLFKRAGGLSTNFSRIHLGYLLQLYPIEILDLLVIVNEIRNKFAHRMEPISFTSPDVSEKCTNLKNSLLLAIWAGVLFLKKAKKLVRNPRARSFELPDDRFRITTARTDREAYLQTCKTLLFLLAWARDIYASEFVLVQPEGPLPHIIAELRKKAIPQTLGKGRQPRLRSSRKKSTPD